MNFELTDQASHFPDQYKKKMLDVHISEGEIPTVSKRSKLRYSGIEDVTPHSRS